MRSDMVKAASDFRDQKQLAWFDAHTGALMKHVPQFGAPLVYMKMDKQGLSAEFCVHSRFFLNCPQN